MNSEGGDATTWIETTTWMGGKKFVKKVFCQRSFIYRMVTQKRKPTFVGHFEIFPGGN